MSITRSILRHLNKSLPRPMPIARGALYIPAPTYFARGIQIEQSATKDAVYMRLLRIGFFTEFPVAHMSYSPRLLSKSRSEFDPLFQGSPETIAGLILQTIEREKLQHDLSVLPDPAEFLRIIAGSDIDRTQANVVFDCACCHALLNDRKEALRLFALAELDRRYLMCRSKLSDRAYAELALNERLTGMLNVGIDITAELRRCCHANALALGFQPAPLPEGKTDGVI